MLLCVLGSPSPFSAFGIHVVRTLAAYMIGDHHYVHICTTEQLRDAWQTRNGRPVVLYSDYLEPRIVDVLIQAGAPTVWFLDDLRDTALHCARAREVELRLGVHFTIQSLCSLLPFIPRPHVTRVRRPGHHVDMGRLVREIAFAFGRDVGDDLVERVCRHLSPAEDEPTEVSIEDCMRTVIGPTLPLHAWTTMLHSADRRTLDEVISGYDALFEGRRATFHWPSSFFVSGSAPYGPILGPIDMTGPARCLAFGPQLHMPMGRWVVHAFFAVAENLSGNVLKADVVANGEVVAEATGNMPIAGRFTFTIEFENASTMLPVDLRFTMMTGAIEGVFELLGVAVEPASDEPEL